MQFSINQEKLNRLIVSQLNTFYDDGNTIKESDLLHYQKEAMERIENSFSQIKLPYYYSNGASIFNHLHGDHYAMYLYLLSNTLYRHNCNIDISSKICSLNKALHGIDVFYEIELPEIFLFVHPVGTVLGRGKYSDYFVVYQNCNVGANEDLIYPTFKGETLLYSKATIIGSCKVGSNTVFGANSFVMNTNIKDNSTVVGSYPNNKIIDNNKNVIDRMFN